MFHQIQVLFVSTMDKMLLMKSFLHRNDQDSSAGPSSLEADSFNCPLRDFVYIGQNCLQDRLWEL